jgi:uncharacterized membrane protein YgdD (TMEM256/DUF423 family)
VGNPFAAAGALFGGSGVALGAFGAHALRGQLPERLLDTWETAVLYQLIHAVSLLVVGTMLGNLPGAQGVSALRLAGWAFVVGVLLFSGSLYLLCLTGSTFFGPVTPLGGIALIFGWIALAFGCLVSRD